jgi:hypothetical protein
MTDRDLDVVRAIRAHLDPAPEGLLERARTRVVTLDTAAAPAPNGRSRWAGVAVPAAAIAVALTVVAVVASVTAVPAPGPPASGVASPSVTATPDPATAAEVIEKLAQVAAAGPPPPVVRPGQQVHLVYESQRGPGGAFLRDDLWFDPNGAILVRFMRTRPDGSTEQGELGESSGLERQRFAEQGPSPEHPTPAWLASLPTDPARLWQVLKQCPSSECAAGGGEPGVVDLRLKRMVRISDVLIPPAQRAGLVRVLASLPDPGVDSVTVRGRTLWAVSHAADSPSPGRPALLVDPATGRIVGAAWLTDEGWTSPVFWTTELT